MFPMLMHLEFGLRTRVVGCHWAKEYIFAFRTVILRTVENASALAWNSMEDRGREPVWRSGNGSRDGVRVYFIHSKGFRFRNY